MILWGAQAWKPIRTLKGPEPTLWSIAFSPDGNTLAIASCNLDKAVRLWDVHTGELKRTLTGRTLFPEPVAFSPDGNTLACGSNDFLTGKLVGGERYSTVVLWDAKTGDLKRTLKAHTDRVSSVAFSPDGKILASGSYDGTVRLWNLSGLK